MSHLVQLLLLLSLILAAAKLAGAASKRLGQPAVFGEILVGLSPLLALITDLTEIGVILLMFVAGLETDLQQMRRVGHVAFWSAAGGVALPMVGGVLTSAAFGLPVF